MKKWMGIRGCAALLLAAILCCHGKAEILPAESSALNETGINTTGTSFTDVLSISADMAVDSAALVLASFTTEGVDKAKTISGYWQIVSTSTSVPIGRALSGNQDKGIASTVFIVTNVPVGAATFKLQHRSSDAVDRIKTLDVNLVAIPLVTDLSNQLAYALSEQVDTTNETTSLSYVDTGLSNDISLVTSTGGAIFVATSFNTQTTGSGETGNWQLQYKADDSGSWSNAGHYALRAMSGTDDLGAAMLYTVIPDLVAGTYNIRLVFKSVGGNAIQTLRGTLASVALSFTNAAGDGSRFLPLLSVGGGGPNDAASFAPIPGVEATLLVPGTNVFAAMSFGGKSSGGANQTAGFDLAVTNSVSGLVDTNMFNQRFFASTADWGSGGSFALFRGMTAGTAYQFVGRHRREAGGVLTTNICLSGFALTTSPLIPTAVELVSFTATQSAQHTVVSWETVCEKDTVGFYLYRLDEHGAWVLLNEQLIPAKGEDGMGGSYQWLDSVSPDVGWLTYRLDEVEVDGSRNTYGPYLRVPGRPSISKTQRTEGGVVLSWPSETGFMYRIYRTCEPGGDLDVVPIVERIPATPPENTFVIPVVPGQTQAFYVLEKVPVSLE